MARKGQSQQEGVVAASADETLPRLEDIPREGDSLDRAQVEEAFGAFRRHVSALQAQVRMMQAAPAGATAEPSAARELASPLAQALQESSEAEPPDDARARPTGAVKVTVNLPEDMTSSLRSLAERDGKTFTQVLKEAISLKLFVEDALQRGAKLLVESPDKTIERIVFR